MGRRRRRSRTSSAWTLVLLALALAAAAAYLWQARDDPPRTSVRDVRVAPGTLRVDYVDVGQGDAVVWTLPDGSVVLFDCGDAAPSADENPLVRHLRDVLKLPEGSDIHAFIASHGHRDHVGGCDEVFERYRVRHVYEAWYEGADRPRSYQRFQELLLAEGATLHTAAPANATDAEVPLRRWDALDLPPSANATATFFWPPGPHEGGWDEVAESGLAVRLVFGEVALCFQGDIETAQEARLAAEDPARDLSCDAYLVGHHGSREASSAAWLRRMDPRVAVVSFGDNPYGHPTAAALCRVQEAGAKVYATHRLGTITLTTDGRGLAVTPEGPETLDYCAAGASYGSG